MVTPKNSVGHIPTVDTVVVGTATHHVLVDDVALRAFLITEGGLSDNVLAADRGPLAPPAHVAAIIQFKGVYCYWPTMTFFFELPSKTCSVCRKGGTLFNNLSVLEIKINIPWDHECSFIFYIDETKMAKLVLDMVSLFYSILMQAANF